MSKEPQVAVNPRLFQSYSWASPEYVDRVTALAEHLIAEQIHGISPRTGGLATRRHAHNES